MERGGKKEDPSRKKSIGKIVKDILESAKPKGERRNRWFKKIIGENH
jgi:hypothetical protein